MFTGSLAALFVVTVLAIAYVRVITSTRHQVRAKVAARLEERARRAAPAALNPLPEVATIADLREKTVDAEFAKAHEADATPTEAELIAAEVERLRAADLDGATVLAADRAMRHAAENGKREAEVLRFPAELMADRGRAANNFAPVTLCGLPLKLATYLHARGFGIRVYVVGYRSNGVPGDTALVARWA